MPFGALERPALSLGLLRAHCHRLGVACETRYLTFAFADRVGLGDYLWLCSDDVPYTAFAGDWLFTEALYGARPYADAAYADEVLKRTCGLSESDVVRLQRMREHVEPYLTHAVQTIAWDRFTFVGFTSVFQQNLASLALAARVKRAHPAVTIAFGGANWEGVMGTALQAQFPFVDLVFSGEADYSFPAVLAARRNGGGVDAISGVSAGGRTPSRDTAPAGRVDDLDSVPAPDFDAFFEQRQRSTARGVPPIILVETARGCWWGERSHCTFCGLNGATMAFRSKTPERVVSEIRALRERHGVASFSVVDDILDMKYFRTVLPMLADAGLGLELFWEVKGNLTREQVRQLRDAGVMQIQPGIESLSDHVLKLMRKGTTAFRNIELLKWCKEYGVKPYWNLLYGFPGESEPDYVQTATYLEAIWHLDPPTGCGPIRLDRFSPYHADPGRYGMVDVRPMAPFTYLYPFERRKLTEIAYYFDFDYADGRAPDAYAREAIGLAHGWMADAAPGRLEMRSLDGSTLELLDTRREFLAAPRRAVLSGWKAACYRACDRAQTFEALIALPALQQQGVKDDELRAFLDRCAHHRFMVHGGRSWLGVAVHTPAREGPDASAQGPVH